MDPLTIEPIAFQRDFPERGFVIAHTLCDSPLFALPRLIELSQTLPADRVEYNAGNIAVGQDPLKTPRTGLSVAETIARIETARSWMVLKNVEQDPDYKTLLDQCLDKIERHVGEVLTGLHSRAGYIFISSPDSVTPFHFDPEHNFLLQIRGTKTMHQFNQHDRSLLPEASIEDKYINPGAHRNQAFKEEFQAKARTFVLQPGEGLFVPTTAPHWVQNGPQVSISFSITFLSDQADRRARLYRINGFMRQRLGWQPTPVGQRPGLDALKNTGYLALRNAKNLLTGRRGRQPAGM